MNIKRNIFKALVLIFLALFISIGLSPGGALADNCQGGADCFKCAERPHRHVPGAAAGMEDSDCRTASQDSTCGFEAGQIPDEFHGIVSSVRSYYPVYAGIFAAASDESRQIRLNGEWVPPLFLSGSDGTVPIYLINQSQLC